jgi:hypothetical protein
MKVIRIFTTSITLISALVLCVSCPFPLYWKKNTGLQVDSSRVTPGVTTKMDMFLRFGNRFHPVDDNEKLFMASFRDADVSIIMLALPTGQFFPVYGKESKALYIVEIEFDDNDVVKRCEASQLLRKLE